MPKLKKFKTEVLAMRTLPKAVIDPIEMLAQLVQKKVAEALEQREASVFEPFFQNGRVSDAIRKLQDVDQLRKFSYYFEDWGCIICHDRTTAHVRLGMCQKCVSRESARLIACVRKRAAARPRNIDEFLDLQNVAQKALAPAIVALQHERKP